MRWMSEFCVRAFMCWGGWMYSEGRERCRKWLEIADALRGLQKINSSQEGKPQPPTFSPSLCLLMLPSIHLSCPPPSLLSPRISDSSTIPSPFVRFQYRPPLESLYSHPSETITSFPKYRNRVEKIWIPDVSKK